MFVYGELVMVGFLWELNNLKNYCLTVLELLRNLKPTSWQGHTSSQELSLPSFSLLGLSALLGLRRLIAAWLSLCPHHHTLLCVCLASLVSLGQQALNSGLPESSMTSFRPDYVCKDPIAK